MDASSEDSDFEPNEEASHASGSDGEASQQPAENEGFERIGDSGRSSPSKVDQLYSAKWQSVKANYIPAYIDLFHAFEQSFYVGELDAEFETTQLGAVTWSGHEKSKFFSALDRHGRHNLKALARAIGTKSEIEIRAYLDALQQTESDRQVYYRQTRNVSQAEIPAAIAINPEVELILDKAADALAAHQERYDYAVAARGAGAMEYIINERVAKELDGISDRFDEDQENHPQDRNTLPPSDLRRLFKLANFVDLSSTLFMVGTPESKRTRPSEAGGRDRKTLELELDDWVSLAHGEETPAITQDAVNDLHTLVVSFVQRIVQSSIFTAESRFRSTTNSWFEPLREVKREDIWAALDIVGSKRDLWGFWIEWPRRRGVKVWSGSHRKGNSSRQYIDFNTAEDLLSKPAYRGRHSRSNSRASTVTMSESEVSLSSELQDDSITNRSGADSGGPDESRQPDGRATIGGGIDSDTSRSDDHPAPDGYSSCESLSLIDSSVDEVSNNDLNEGHDHTSGDTPKLLPGQRKRRLEHDMKRHMDTIDAEETEFEQNRIRELLDIKEADSIKEESESERPAKRPKVPRKSLEDVRIWQVGVHLQAWEAYETPVSTTASKQ